ncbi:MULTISPECIES: NfeD family protein [Citricoccus]|uniref:NfeD family protein n=1 Tax=Citricoccus TaxID=169133 RepID=UPI000255F5DB|nr:NfeD family protein [Citricoccus sp. CH26A]
MVEWVGDNLWAFWLTVAVVFAVVEVFILDLVFLMLAAGAAAALATALAGGEAWLQIVMFSGTSLLMLAAVRPTALRHLKKGPADQLTNVDTLPGRTAVVLEDTTGDSGLAKVDGETWTARSATGVLIPAGSEVEIDRVQGATLIIHPRPSIDWESGRSGQTDGP